MPGHLSRARVVRLTSVGVTATRRRRTPCSLVNRFVSEFELLWTDWRQAEDRSALVELSGYLGRRARLASRRVVVGRRTLSSIHCYAGAAAARQLFPSASGVPQDYSDGCTQVRLARQLAGGAARAEAELRDAARCFGYDCAGCAASAPPWAPPGHERLLARRGGDEEESEVAIVSGGRHRCDAAPSPPSAPAPPRRPPRRPPVPRSSPPPPPPPTHTHTHTLPVSPHYPPPSCRRTAAQDEDGPRG